MLNLTFSFTRFFLVSLKKDVIRQDCTFKFEDSKINYIHIHLTLIVYLRTFFSWFINLV